MSKLAEAIEQVCLARRYADDLLNHIDEKEWYRMPEGVTHVAWQVGHLAVCEYGLALKRIRGEQDGDGELVPDPFRKAYGKGSTPESDPSKSFSPAEIRSVLRRVHLQTVEELNSFDDEDVEQPTDGPSHPMFNTKLGALHWCAQHEFIHCGQIALLRRQFGAQPLR